MSSLKWREKVLLNCLKFGRLCKWFVPRSISGSYSVITRVRVVLLVALLFTVFFSGSNYRNGKLLCFWDDLATYEMSSVEKFTMVEMKLSLMMTPRMVLQSVACSPSNKQIDSKASLTAGGGLPMERTSTRCCFLIDLTAVRKDSNAPLWVPSLKYKLSLKISTHFVCIGFENLVVNHFDFPWFMILFFLWPLRYIDANNWNNIIDHSTTKCSELYYYCIK